MHLKLSLLGQYRAEIDQKGLAISRAKKIEALLVYLAVAMDLPHSRLALDGLLFPELPAAAARTNLRQTLTRLRRAVQDDVADPPFLLIEEATLQFNPNADCEIDLHTFRNQIQGCSQHKGKRTVACQACIDAVDAAVRCYRGPFLDGFFIDESVAFEEWLEQMRERVQDEAQSAFTWLADHYEQCGSYELADTYAQRRLDLEPWNEEAHRQRMRLLARRGQRSAALAQYKRCRDLLAAELGVEPSAETNVLLEQIRHTAPSRPHNLPQPNNKSLIGRESLIAQIRTMLVHPERQLITLTGAGGIGKTQLAVHIANQFATDHIGPFMHGVYFVTFAGDDDLLSTGTTPISAATLVNALAQALALSFTGASTPKTQLIDTLRSQEILLLIDNCESLQEEARLLCAAILQGCRGVTILATSRIRLQLAEEWVVDVPGLGYPDQPVMEEYGGQPFMIEGDLLSYPAIELFVQRAQQADHAFNPTTLTMDEERAILQISRLTQGMPLALELAATWVRVLTCHQIAEAIQTTLELLATTALTHPRRHQSLRAVFTYSWQLLSPAEQDTLAALTVFRGSFSIEAATAITSASIFVLAQLVNHSLLYSIAGSDAKRYRLHPLLRQFAAEKLLDHRHQIYRTSHARFYGTWLEKQHSQLHGAALVTALQAIEADIENIRSGWQWAVDRHQLTLIGQYMPSLYIFYALRGWRHEGCERFTAAAALRKEPTQAAQLSDDHALIFSGLLSRLAGFQYELGQIDVAERFMQEGLALGHLVEDPDDLALSYKRLGQVAYQRGDYAQAIKFFEFTLQILQETNARLEIAHTLMTLGAVARDQRDYSQARAFFEQSVFIYREEAYIWGLAHGLRLLTTTIYQLVDLASAEILYQESVALARQLPSRDVEALILHNWAQILEEEERYAEAETSIQTALSYFQAMDHVRGSVLCWESLGRLMAKCERMAEARSFLELSFRAALTLQDTPLLLRIVAEIAKQAVYLQQPNSSTIRIDAEPDSVVALLDLLAGHPGSTPALQQEAVRLLQQIMAPDTTAMYHRATRPPLHAPPLHEIERVVTSVLTL